MAEPKDRYDAFIYPSWKLEIETIEDSFEKSIAKHEIPFRDGALLEDMGQKAHVIKFRCYFLNENYESHISLINFLNKKELVEFSHPKYGVMEGYIESMSVRHDDRKETAEIDLTFVENLRGEIEPKAYVDVAMSGEEAYVNGWSETMSDFETDVKNNLGSEAGAVLKKELDPNKGILEQYSGLTAKSRNYIKSVDSYVRTLSGSLNKISNPANSLTSTINFGTNLPGRVIGSLAKCVERYSILFKTTKNSPTRFLSSYKNGMKSLEKSSGSFSKYTKIGGALGVGLATAYLFKDDQTNKNTSTAGSKAKSFDALGKLLKK